MFTERVGTLYAEEAIGVAGGPAWHDPALPDRGRSAAVLAALTFGGVLGDRLDAHLDRAIRHGLDQHARMLPAEAVRMPTGVHDVSQAPAQLAPDIVDQMPVVVADRDVVALRAVQNDHGPWLGEPVGRVPGGGSGF